MTVPYIIDSSSSLYKNYYAIQAGGGMPVFRGGTVQYGSGLGGVFSKLFKGIAPLLKSVAKTAGKQLLSTGANIANDVLDGKSFGESTKRNLSEGGKQLLSNLTSAILPSKVGGAKKRKIKSKKKSSKSKRRRLTSDIFQQAKRVKA